jgi:hypothetical protein
MAVWRSAAESSTNCDSYATERHGTTRLRGIRSVEAPPVATAQIKGQLCRCSPQDREICRLSSASRVLPASRAPTRATNCSRNTLFARHCSIYRSPSGSVGCSRAHVPQELARARARRREPVMADGLTSRCLVLLLFVGVAAQAASGVTDGEIPVNWHSVVG